MTVQPASRVVHVVHLYTVEQTKTLRTPSQSKEWIHSTTKIIKVYRQQ